MKRPRFYRPDPLPRKIYTPEKEEESLSESTLGKLLRVDTKDPTDLEWIALAKVQIARNPSLTDEQLDIAVGRKQRVTSKNVSISQASKDVQDEMRKIRSMVNQGLTNNTADRQALFANLNAVMQAQLTATASIKTGMDADSIVRAGYQLADTQNASANTKLIIDALALVGLPDPTQVGLPSQVDASDFKTSDSTIRTFVLSKNQSATPIKNLLGNQVSIDDAIADVTSDPSLVLDLKSLRVTTRSQTASQGVAFSFVSPTGLPQTPSRRQPPPLPSSTQTPVPPMTRSPSPVKQRRPTSQQQQQKKGTRQQRELDRVRSTLQPFPTGFINPGSGTAPGS